MMRVASRAAMARKSIGARLSKSIGAPLVPLG
jgi:hypothetical protein